MSDKPRKPRKPSTAARDAHIAKAMARAEKRNADAIERVRQSYDAMTTKDESVGSGDGRIIVAGVDPFVPSINGSRLFEAGIVIGDRVDLGHGHMGEVGQAIITTDDGAALTLSGHYILNRWTYMLACPICGKRLIVMYRARNKWGCFRCVRVATSHPARKIIRIEDTMRRMADRLGMPNPLATIPYGDLPKDKAITRRKLQLLRLMWWETMDELEVALKLRSLGRPARSELMKAIEADPDCPHVRSR